jgi:alkylhydroperoxidase family enzyme
MINGCRYCLQRHLASSRRVGLTPEDWCALKQGNYSRFSEKERLTLTYVEKLRRSPPDIAPAEWAGKPYQLLY